MSGEIFQQLFARTSAPMRAVEWSPRLPDLMVLPCRGIGIILGSMGIRLADGMRSQRMRRLVVLHRATGLALESLSSPSLLKQLSIFRGALRHQFAKRDVSP